MDDKRNDLVELERSRSQDEIDEVCAILDEAEIPYKLGSDGVVSFDLSTIGVGGDPQTIISVPNYLFDAAREKMKERYSDTSLPDDYYLHSFTDQELIDLLATESDWSPYDVAHAEKMFEARGLSMDDIVASKAKHEDQIAYGKPAPKWMVWVPIVMMLLWFATIKAGGYFLFLLMSLGISWSVVSMKAKHPHKQHYLYDMKSRETSKIILYVSLMLTAVGVALVVLNH